MTKKYLVITAFFLLILALSYGISRRGKSSTPTQPNQTSPEPKVPTSEVPEDWQTYRDDIYGLTISYPKGWGVSHTTIAEPNDPLYVIRDEYRFDGDDGEGLHIMTFLLPKDQTLRGWFEEYRFPEPKVEAPEEENAIIGGLPAFMLVVPETRNSPPAFWALWISKGYVFWLEGSLKTQTFTKILESVRFEGVDSSSAITKLPNLPELKLWKYPPRKSE